MSDEKQASPKPVPFSGYLDLLLSLCLPLFGLSFVLLIVFWYVIRPSVPDTSLTSWVVGIVTLSLIVGVLNAVRYYRKSYHK
jgi:hypothetical protein